MAHTYHRTSCTVFSAPRDGFALIAAPSTTWNTLRRDVGNANLHIRAISGTSNHLHLLLDMPSTRTVADVLRELKANSSARIRRKTTHFGWQNGDRVISVGPLAVQNVIGYINPAANAIFPMFLEVLWLIVLKTVEERTQRRQGGFA